eukprot:7691132-Karenia_brevis.AAC.1
MIAVLQAMPTRAKIVKEQLVVAPPTAQEKLGEMGHQVGAQRGRLQILQVWATVAGQTPVHWGLTVSRS